MLYKLTVPQPIYDRWKAYELENPSWHAKFNELVLRLLAQHFDEADTMRKSQGVDDLNQTVRYRVYAIIPHHDESDQRWYIGCTQHLRVRLAKHWASGKWQYPFEYVVLDRSEANRWAFDRSAIERSWIRRFDPEQLRNKVGQH